MSMVGFPLLLIPLAIYNIIVFLMPGVSFAEPLVKLTLMSGAEWPVTLSDMLAGARHPVVAVRGHQGRAPGAKYLTDHLLSLMVFCGAVAEFVLLAAVRHLDLFPADHAGAGGFPVGHCVARPARSARSRPPAAVSRQGRTKARRAAPEPQFDPRRLSHRCRRRLRSPNPCCWIAPSRKSRMPTPRPDHRRRSRPRDCSRATARRPRRMRQAALIFD